MPGAAPWQGGGGGGGGGAGARMGAGGGAQLVTGSPASTLGNSAKAAMVTLHSCSAGIRKAALTGVVQSAD